MSAPASRPRPVIDPDAADDDGITMQAAAGMIGCSVDTVRELIGKGYLDAWRVGVGPKRSPIRVRVGSVRRYKTERTIIPMDAAARHAPQRAHNARQREALAFIQRLGRKRP